MNLVIPVEHPRTKRVVVLLPVLMDMIEQLIRALLEIHQRGSLHVMDSGNICVGCGNQWPCRTKQLIDDFAIAGLLETPKQQCTLCGGLDSTHRLVHVRHNNNVESIVRCPSDLRQNISDI